MPPKRISAFFQSPPTSVATNAPANTSQMPSILPGLGQYRIQLDQLAARRSSTISLATSTLTFPLSHPTFKQPSGKPPLPYLGCGALFATVNPIANRALLQEEYNKVWNAAITIPAQPGLSKIGKHAAKMAAIQTLRDQLAQEVQAKWLLEERSFISALPSVVASGVETLKKLSPAEQPAHAAKLTVFQSVMACVSDEGTRELVGLHRMFQIVEEHLQPSVEIAAPTNESATIHQPEPRLATSLVEYSESDDESENNVAPAEQSQAEPVLQLDPVVEELCRVCSRVSMLRG